MQASFEAIEELEPGDKWAALFARHWPRYEGWFLQEGEAARTSYAESLRALREHMPELVPTYERLVELAGNTDLIARFMSSFCPPSYLIRCSQAVWSGDAPFLVRNYDYNPQLYEGVIIKTAWNGRGPKSTRSSANWSFRASGFSRVTSGAWNCAARCGPPGTIPHRPSSPGSAAGSPA